MNVPFVLFGFQHLVVMGLTFAAPAVPAFAQRRLRHDSFDRAIRIAFAALLTGTWIAWYVLFIERHWITLNNVLPMNLCDWTTVAVIVACLRRSQRAAEIAYFWSLAGTLQGVITPDVNYGFPEPQFVVFMLGHAAIIAAVIYLVFGTGLRPRFSSLPRVVGWTLIYAASAAALDWVAGTNYGFFRAKPNHATLFDLMPDWPAYIPVMIGLGIAFTVLLYLPWFVTDAVRRRSLAAAFRDS